MPTNFLREFQTLCAKYHRDPQTLKLIAVTKNQPVAKIQRLLQEQNFQAIGESRIQEAQAKFSALPKCERHLIGHLQTNKVHLAIQLFDVIQSVDSVRLAQKLNAACASQHKIMPIFLQANLGAEPQKFGFLANELAEAWEQIQQLPHLKVQGLMVMGVKDNLQKTREVFQRGRELQQQFQLPEFSAGMSGDFALALECGANVFRIGRRLFEF